MEMAERLRRNRKLALTRRNFTWGLMVGTAVVAQLPFCGDVIAAPAIRVTGDSVDPLFTRPFIDIDEWRDTPVRHRYVHGGFQGTDALFSIYFPPKEQYQRRFFQPISAVSGNENGAQQFRPQPPREITMENNSIGFAFASGGYLVESNMGNKTMYPLADHTIVGYRASAAVAKYSRVLAAQMYGPHRPYGYAFGGSGGGLKTCSLAENTSGIWDGVVPYVLPSPMATNVYPIQAMAIRILKDKWPQIVDAIDPGGSGDMYSGLNSEEAAVLREATRMGLVPKAWFMYQRLGYGPLAVLIDDFVRWDPTYFTDFWTKPGYMGANPPESLERARIQQTVTITRVVLSNEARERGLPLPMAAVGTNVVPAAFQFDTLPAGDLKGASLIFKSGGALGQRISASGVQDGLVLLGIGKDAFAFMQDVKPGDQVLLDNSIYLAAQTYHRHSVPSKDFYVYDQFRGPGGKPIYPQRPVLIPPKFAEQGAGSVQNGRFGGKMIVVHALTDEHASPWNADWYRNKVRHVLGPKIDDRFRLWYVDNAMHGALPYTKPDRLRISGYLGVLQQALRDLTAWVEQGVSPPANTAYKVADGQIVIAETVAARKSIQPVVKLTANGGTRVDVKVGQAVRFSALVEVPPQTGTIVAADWDFEGTADFPLAEKIADPHQTRLTFTQTYTFSKPGTYFPVVRVASQRTGNTRDQFARPLNLDRVRVVVT